MRIWASIAASLCCFAQAAWDDQFAGLWLNRDTPGWGISVQQQGDHVVATLLTYGSAGQAKWYQAPDIRLPEWNPYVLWDAMTVSGDLLEGASARNAGWIIFTFDEDRASVVYQIDGTRQALDIARFVFAPIALNGTFTGASRLASYGKCEGPLQTDVVRLTAATSADNTVRLSLAKGTATCTAQGTYRRIDFSPSLVGRAQCTGINGISETPFGASDLRVGRETVSFNLSLGDSSCGYYGQVVAARSDARLGDAEAPHDDASGLWTTDGGWTMSAHLQGNSLFGIVLAADGSWYAAPSASYDAGQDGDFVVYRGDLWSASKTSPDARTYQLAPVGIMELEVDAAGYNSASYGPNGIVSARAARLTWPREASVEGSYFGVRTNLQPLALAPILGGFAISGGPRGMTITTGDAGTERCEFSGALDWQGQTGRILGTGSCSDALGTHTGFFTANDIRMTDQGVTMRYSFLGARGSIAGLRQ